MRREITVYTKDDCPYCEKLKAHLTREHIPFQMVVVNNKLDREELYDKWGLVDDKRTMPQLFVRMFDHDWERVGGHDDVISDNRFWDPTPITFSLTQREIRYVLYRMGVADPDMSSIRVRPGNFTAEKALSIERYLSSLLPSNESVRGDPQPSETPKMDPEAGT